MTSNGRREPFDAIYNHAVAYPRRLPPLGEAAAPRRFAEGLVGTVAAVVGVAFLVGATTTAWFFAAVFIVASMAAVVKDSCFGAYVVTTSSDAGRPGPRNTDCRTASRDG